MCRPELEAAAIEHIGEGPMRCYYKVNKVMPLTSPDKHEQGRVDSHL